MSFADKVREALNQPALVKRRRTEERLVRELGDAIGYGRVMQLAEKIWNQLQPGGAHSTGPCVKFLVPCPCNEELGLVTCDWCCGSRRVTERVREAMKAR